MSWPRYVFGSKLKFTGLTFSSPAFHSLHPFTPVCLDPQCQRSLYTDTTNMQDRKLVEELRPPITVFTRAYSAVPGYTTSRYCRSWFLKLFFRQFNTRSQNVTPATMQTTTYTAWMPQEPDLSSYVLLLHSRIHTYLGTLFLRERLVWAVCEYDGDRNCVHIYDVAHLFITSFCFNLACSCVTRNS